MGLIYKGAELVKLGRGRVRVTEMQGYLLLLAVTLARMF